MGKEAERKGVELDLIEKIKFDNNGLIPAIIQDYKDNTVLMVAFMNKEAVQKTLETGLTHFWSRSRQKLWQKGETSGNIQRVKDIFIDCDTDTLLIKVEQKGPACHTNKRSCFYRRFNSEMQEIEDKELSSNTLKKVFDIIMDRKANPKEGSYVASLFKDGKDKILKKVSEEAGEVLLASKDDKRDAIIYEIADLLFHTLVVMGYHDIAPQEIYDELEKRFNKPHKGQKEKH